MEIETDKLRCYVEEQEQAADVAEALGGLLEEKGMENHAKLAWLTHFKIRKTLEGIAHRLGIKTKD